MEVAVVEMRNHFVVVYQEEHKLAGLASKRD